VTSYEEFHLKLHLLQNTELSDKYRLYKIPKWHIPDKD